MSIQTGPALKKELSSLVRGGRKDYEQKPKYLEHTVQGTSEVRMQCLLHDGKVLI